MILFLAAKSHLIKTIRKMSAVPQGRVIQLVAMRESPRHGKWWNVSIRGSRQGLFVGFGLG